jgi:hypothetical protein
VAAFVFMLGILSAAPPINVWAMLMAAGANMPYVGFDPPRWRHPGGGVTGTGLGRRALCKEAILAGLLPPPGMTCGARPARWSPS